MLRKEINKRTHHKGCDNCTYSDIFNTRNIAFKQRSQTPAYHESYNNNGNISHDPQPFVMYMSKLAKHKAE